MRNPRIAFVVALALGACSEPGPAGPQGPQGERGPEGPPGGTAEIAALQARVAALEAAVAMVAQVPHLIAEDGTDLGRYTREPDCVWIESEAAELCLSWREPRPQPQIYFDAPNCTGNAYVLAEQHFASPLLMGPDGAVFRATSNMRTFSIKSVQFGNGADCNPDFARDGLSGQSLAPTPLRMNWNPRRPRVEMR